MVLRHIATIEAAVTLEERFYDSRLGTLFPAVAEMQRLRDAASANFEGIIHSTCHAGTAIICSTVDGLHRAGILTLPTRSLYSANDRGRRKRTYVGFRLQEVFLK